MLRIDLLTIFPDFFKEVFDFGIVRRAKESGIVEIRAHDIREYARNKHKKVDDRPFGGGEGMVMMAEPIFIAVEDLLGTSNKEEYEDTTRVVLLSPQGKPFAQQDAREFSEKSERILIICGRYEGIDERVNAALVTDEISIGDYVLSGGEPAGIVLTDAIVRLLPNALGNDQSAENDSFSNGILDFPQYTQPRDFRNMEVPKVLLSGNHGEIANWRQEKAREKTKRIRRDLLDKEKSDQS